MQMLYICMCTVRVPICVPPVLVHVTLAAPASIHKSAHVRVAVAVAVAV
jgi:hypothetical protein